MEVERKVTIPTYIKTEKESGMENGLLCQVTWPAHLNQLDLNPTEMIWNRLDHIVKVKQVANAQHL